MPRGAQVVYPKDLGPIVIDADVFPGARVIEAGTGSGALTIALCRAVGPEGRVVSYELRAEHRDQAVANIEDFFGSIPTVDLREGRRGDVAGDAGSVRSGGARPARAVGAAGGARRGLGARRGARRRTSRRPCRCSSWCLRCRRQVPSPRDVRDPETRMARHRVAASAPTPDGRAHRLPRASRAGLGDTGERCRRRRLASASNDPGSELPVKGINLTPKTRMIGREKVRASDGADGPGVRCWPTGGGEDRWRITTTVEKYEKQVHELQTQVKFLEEEVGLLRRRLTNAPRQVDDPRGEARRDA